MKGAGHGKYIGFKHTANLRQVLVMLRPRTDRNARSGDHHIGCAVLGDECARGLVQLGFDRHVRRIHLVLLGVIHGGANLLQHVTTTPDQTDDGALLGIFLRQSRADTAGCAGDKNSKCHDGCPFIC